MLISISGYISAYSISGRVRHLQLSHTSTKTRSLLVRNQHSSVQWNEFLSMDGVGILARPLFDEREDHHRQDQKHHSHCGCE